MEPKKYDLLCVGMALVDSIIKGFDPEPVSASGYRAESGSLNVGGEAVNEAIAAAKLGVHTGILCHLGADGAGEMVMHALTQADVDCSSAVRSPIHPTPVTTMFVNDDGTRRSVTNQAHRYSWHPEQYRDTLGNAGIISIGSLFRAPFDDPDVIRETVTLAHRAGALVLADTKLPNFRRLSLTEIGDVLSMIDYIFPNEDEARYYTMGAGYGGAAEGSADCPYDPSDMADILLSLGIKNVIIKLGSKGCYFKNASEEIRLNALPVEAMDATGAGDNFIAGFASRILAGDDHPHALAFANACGAICTTAVGASAGLKNEAQVRRLLGQGVLS